MDLIYNPVTQKYTDKEFNSKIESQEKQAQINNIIKNTDHALKLEQHFNIINLQDKLKGLESHPSYPKPSIDRLRKRLENSKVEYNIVSNIGLDKHHYSKPENRPVVTDSELKGKKFYAAAVSDYNNVYNRYLLNHDEKIRVEREAGQIEAAAKFWKRNDYDPIKMKFHDDQKEKEFQAAKQTKSVSPKRRLPDINSLKG